MKIEVKEYVFEELEEGIEKEFQDLSEEEHQQTEDSNVKNQPKNEQAAQSVDKEAIQKELEEIVEVAKQEALKQAELIKEQAKKEGFELGYKDGYEQGLKEAEQKLAQTTNEYSKKLDESIQKLIQTTQDINNRYKELENAATDAILTIVNKVISKKIEEDKEIISGMVKEALGLTESSKLKIKLNPEDAKNVEENIDTLSEDKSISIVSDDNLPRGSILIEEENGNVIDAGVDSKMEQVASSIKNG